MHCYMYVLNHSVAQGSPFAPNENRNDLPQVVISVFVRCDAIPELLNSLYFLLEGSMIWKRMHFNSRPVARIFYGWVRSVDHTDQRAPEALFTRGVRGHAPPRKF